MKTAWITLLTLTLMFALTVPTQAAGPAKYGVKAGITLSDQTYDYSEAEVKLDVEPGNRTGLALGFFVEKPLLKAFSVRGAAEYVQKGSELSALVVDGEGAVTGTQKLKDRVTYISLGALGKVNVPIGKMLPYVLFGPRLDFKASHDTEFASVLSDDLKSTVVGLTFGIGQQFPVQSLGSLFIEAQYLHDLSNAYDKNGITVKNKCLTVMAGLTF